MTGGPSELDVALERDGFAVAELLTADELADLRETWERLDAEVKAYPFSATILSPDVAYRVAVDDAVRRVLGPAIERLLGPTRLAYAAFVAKRPDPMSAVPIHQDPSFAEERFGAVNVWAPLSDVDAVNGCLRVLRGSHRLTAGPRGTDFRVPYLDLIDPRELEDVPLRAGQACLMAGSLYHASEPNRSDRPRVAAATLALPPATPLRYYFAPPGAHASGPRTFEVFDVPDDFHCRHALGSRPGDLAPIGLEQVEHPPLTREQLEALLEGALSSP